MGSNTFGAAGVALPSPLPLYPVTVANLPGLASTNRISLPPGGNILVPSGTWEVNQGQYSSMQVLDPVTNTWTPVSTAGGQQAEFGVNSDGVNYRIINPTGFPVGAIVNSSGSGFTSAPAVAPGGSGGGSTWISLVGGAVSQLNIATAGSGAGYLVPPIINIAAPPSPGVQATAICTISGGTLATFTIINPGAGYTTAPAVTVVPQASDTQFFPTGASTVTTTNASVTSQLSFVGMVTAVLLTNEGTQPLASAPPLTFSGGAGSGAAATMVMALAIKSLTTTTGGSGFASGTFLQTFGGTVTSAAGATNSSAVSTQLVIPRQVSFATATASGTGIDVINPPSPDQGFFSQAPTIIAFPGPLVTGSSSPGTNAVITPTMGGVNDTVFITPL